MARLANVIRRAGIYHFRRVVPLVLRDRLKRRELVRSLDTSVPVAARLRADLLYRASERLFQAANSMLPQDKLARLVKDFYHLVLEIDDHTRLTGSPLNEDDQARHIAYLDGLFAEHSGSLARNHFNGVELATSIVMSRQGLQPEALNPMEHNQVRQAILRAGLDVARALRARYEGDFTYEPKDPLLRSALAASSLHPIGSARSDLDGPPAVVDQISATPSSPQASSEGTVSSGTQQASPFSEIAAVFRRERGLVKEWDAQTVAQAGATYRLFVEVCGDRPLSTYTRADADRFRRQVSLLPGDYSKAVQYRGLTVPEILKLAETETATREVVRLTQRTVKRHFSALSGLWASALSAGSVADNIFSGFRFASVNCAKDQRPAWTRDQLKRLFAAPVWTGCKSNSRRHDQGLLILRDEYHWIPLIGVLSGLRQEEICQLHVVDVRHQDGIAFFDINEEPPRVLKNRAAKRLVPVHRDLLRLGFLDHVEACRKAGVPLLFPNLKPGGAKDRLGHAFSKWFTRARKRADLYRRKLDFHALRHTATTFMLQSGVESAIVDDVTGHETPGETARYNKFFLLSQLQAAIDTIDLGFDLTTLAPIDRGLQFTTGLSRRSRPRIQPDASIKPVKRPRKRIRSGRQ